LKAARHARVLFHASMTQHVHFSGKVVHGINYSRKDEKYDNGQSPLKIQEEDQASHKSYCVTEDIDDAAREEPAQTFYVAGQAGHEISGLSLIKKSLGQGKHAIDKIALNVESHLLLEAAEKELLQHAHEFFGHQDEDEKQNSSGKKSELALKDHLIDDVPGDEGLGESKHGGDENETESRHAFLPVPAQIRFEVSEVGRSVCIAFGAGHRILRQLPRKSLLQIAKPAVVGVFHVPDMVHHQALPIQALLQLNSRQTENQGQKIKP
jgi:hypothetical protein